MENKAHAMAAGAFVIGVAALLVALALWLMRDTEVRNVYELSTRDSVAGLQPQAAVRFRGVPVGRVTSIGFDPTVQGNVLVRISVDDSTPVTKSTFAELAYQGVTGLAYVQLDDKGGSKELLPADSDHPARIPLKPSLFSKLSERGEQIVDQVDAVTKRASDLLSPANQKALVDSVTAIGQAAGSMTQLAQRLDETVSKKLDPALEAFSPAAKDASAAMKSLQQASDDVSKTAEEVGKTAARLNQKDGPIDRLAEGTAALSHAADSFNSATLPRVNRVTDEASRAARQLSRAATSINDNPQSLLFGNGATPPGPGEAGFTQPAAGR